MKRSLVFVLAIMAIANSATAQKARDLAPEKQALLPRLYAIDLDKVFINTTQYHPSTIELAGKARANKGCGTDTYFTISSDFDNALAYADRDTALAAFNEQKMTTKVRQMFYPNGEVYEMEAPKRLPLGNSEAVMGTYRVTFSDGRRYRMRHYTSFASGYYVHLDTYNLSKDDLRAAPCFAALIETLTFRTIEAK
jgi:hypothetical protein